MGVEVRLAIDAIVVEGMGARDVPRFRSALSDELQRHAEDVDDWAAFSAPSDDRPIIVGYNSRPEDAAVKVANSIFGGGR